MAGGRTRNAAIGALMVAALIGLAPGPSPAQMVSADRKAADDAYRSRRNDDAIALYRKVVESDPGDAEAWFRLGLSLHNDSQFRDALPAYERSRDLKFARLLSQYNIGCAYARLGNTQQALAALEKAVAMGFNDVRQMRDDPDLVGIRSEPRFSSILQDASRPTDKFPAARRLDGLYGLWEAKDGTGPTGTMTCNTGAKGFSRQLDLVDSGGRELYLFFAYSAPDATWSVSGADGEGGTYRSEARVGDGQLTCDGVGPEGGRRLVLRFSSASGGTLSLEERRGTSWAVRRSWSLARTGLPSN